MNDEDFIIISSDEEIDTNNVAEDVKEPDNDKKMEQVVEYEASSVTQNSLPGSEEKDTGQCSQKLVVDDCSSKNVKLNISTETQNATNTNEKLEEPEIPIQNINIEKEKEIESNTHENNENDNCVEMSSNVNKFIELILSLEKEEDVKARLQKKITKYHNLADPEYLKSDEFNNLLENGITKLNKNHSCLYEIIKEVVDCLLSKRVLFHHKKPQKNKSSGREIESSNEKDGTENNQDDIYFDSDEKNYKIVKKLSKTLKKLGKKIKEIEESEVDLSDEEDSSYLKMQRYRERFCQVYKKLCEYTNQTGNAKRIFRRKITFNGTNNLQLDRSIELWLNKTKEFPDYASVLKFLGESNENLNLGWSKDKLKNMAVDVFSKIGKSLQLRRQYDLWESFNSFLENEVDPSENDEALKQQLVKNFEVASEKEKEILTYYANLQDEKKLEPMEVPEDEANYSPVESGDEDENEIEEVEKALCSTIPVEIEDEGDESDGEENDQENVNLLVVNDETTGNEESMQRDASGKPECVPNSVDEDNNEEINISDNTEKKNVTNSIKEDHFEKTMTCEGVSSGVKRSPDVEITECIKRPKISETDCRDNDSDSEITIISDDDTNFKPEKNDSSFEIRKVHQINYTFINNNFNHNAMLINDNIIINRKAKYSSFKSVRYPRISFPLSDLTNIKYITSKYLGMRGRLEKKKTQESLRVHPFEKNRFRYNQPVLLDKFNNNCALQNESGTENVKSQNEPDQGNEKDSCEGDANEEGIGSSDNGASGGGNGQDNNEDDGNKKPSDEGKQKDEDVEKKDDEADEDDNDNDDEKEKCETDHNDEKNGGSPVESNGNKMNETIEDSFVTPEQLVCVTFDPPPPKRKSAKRITGNKARIHKNGGSASTSRSSSMKLPYSCKPYEGNIRYTRSKPRQSIPLNLTDAEKFKVQQKKQSTPVKAAKSDEEIVKNFLQHSPSSISITSPRKRITENKPSPSILQAIQTLSRLKSITTTVVKASSSERQEDITVIGESPKKRDQSFLLPKIVTVQGNVSGFDSMDTSNATNTFPVNKTSCTRRRKIQRSPANNPKQSNPPRKPAKKNVEYVELD